METGLTDPNDLIVGDFPIATDRATFLLGYDAKRGDVVGRITASGKYILSVFAAADGSQNPIGVVAFDVNAVAADKDGQVYFTGEFNAAKCRFGAGHTAATVNASLRAASSTVFLRTL